jgi:hypothetical protein
MKRKDGKVVNQKTEMVMVSQAGQSLEEYRSKRESGLIGALAEGQEVILTQT